MVPKIIHYSWFSNDPMPPMYIQIMENWKRVLPDYELKLWDANALKEANIMFANEAVNVKKWAFAADAIRVYAVYHYGGIWLDGDVVVNKSFNPFLDCRMFIGKEHTMEFQNDGCNHNLNLLTSHCFGAEKGHPFVKECLDYYQNRHFVLSDKENLPEGLRYNMRLMPSIQALLAVKYGYQGRVPNMDEIEVLDEDIRVYPPYYFDAPRYHSVKDSVCVHLKNGSWRAVSTWNHAALMPTVAYKKGWLYYAYSWANKLLMKKGYYLKVISV